MGAEIKCDRCGKVFVQWGEDFNRLCKDCFQHVEASTECKIDGYGKDGFMSTERGQVLLEAHKIINGDRQQSYGNPEDTHQVIADLWNGYLEALLSAHDYPVGPWPTLEPKDVALMMVLFKIGRELNGAGCKDNMVDAAGYIALAADMNEERAE